MCLCTGNRACYGGKLALYSSFQWSVDLSGSAGRRWDKRADEIRLAHTTETCCTAWPFGAPCNEASVRVFACARACERRKALRTYICVPPPQRFTLPLVLAQLYNNAAH